MLPGYLPMATGKIRIELSKKMAFASRSPMRDFPIQCCSIRQRQAGIHLQAIPAVAASTFPKPHRNGK